jgi:hypothetical protein
MNFDVVMLLLSSRRSVSGRSFTGRSVAGFDY